ncbi:hypothetical protein RJ639_025337 [Escallonia herrerae]|uniref:Uncharacterized protein n=1 Tax=Escallonia herrerae TaxID=1293975 RepID=A0AA88S719_9ASTE|nr:hypothetical protein RJ639_025337 [Escallonia herrerae]
MAVLGMHDCPIHYLLHLKTFHLFFRMTFLIAEVCLLASSHQECIPHHVQHLFIREILFHEGNDRGRGCLIVFTGILFELYLVSYSKADDRFLSNGGDAGITMHENL